LRNLTLLTTHSVSLDSRQILQLWMVSVGSTASLVHNGHFERRDDVDEDVLVLSLQQPIDV
jgi:hypothetical protein